MPGRSRPVIPRRGPRRACRSRRSSGCCSATRRWRSGPTARLGQCAWMAQMLRNCTAGRYAVEQGAHGASGRVQPRLPARTARRDRHALRSSAAWARCNCSARRRNWTARRETSPCCKQSGVPFELLDRDQLARVEPALASARTRLAGALAPAERRDRRLPDVHAPARRDGRGARRANSVSARHQRPRDRRWPHQRRADRRQAGNGRSATCWRSAATRRALLTPLGIKVPVYPVKGYSLTVPIADDSAWRRTRPCSTRPTRSRSRVSTTASASAAWRRCAVLT